MFERMNFQMIGKFRRWLPAVAVLAAIAYFSNQPFAAQDIRPWLVRHIWLMHRVRELPPVRFTYDEQVMDSRADPAGFVQFWVRKGMHVLLYGLLGLALVTALGNAGLKGGSRWLAAAAALLVVAALDEQHQLVVHGRTGRVLDVLVDLAGFGFFVVLRSTFNVLRSTFRVHNSSFRVRSSRFDR
ncbi:MAG: VanZ family protein [Bacillota bacterium]